MAKDVYAASATRYWRASRLREQMQAALPAPDASQHRVRAAIRCALASPTPKPLATISVAMYRL